MPFLSSLRPGDLVVVKGWGIYPPSSPRKVIRNTDLDLELRPVTDIRSPVRNHAQVRVPVSPWLTSGNSSSMSLFSPPSALIVLVTLPLVFLPTVYLTGTTPQKKREIVSKNRPGFVGINLQKMELVWVPEPHPTGVADPITLLRVPVPEPPVETPSGTRKTS